MEKRTVLAIVLSMMVLLLWSAMMPKPQPVENTTVATKLLASAEVEVKVAASAPVSETALGLGAESRSGALIQFSNGATEITFIEGLAAVKEVKFQEALDYSLPLRYGFLVADKSLVFKKEKITADSISFVALTPTKKITKVFTFENRAQCVVRLDISITNLSNLPIEATAPIVLGALDISPQNKNVQYEDVAVALQEKTLHLNPRKSITYGNIKFLGLRDRYFCAIIEPAANGYSGIINKVDAQISEISLSSGGFTLAPGSQKNMSFRIYLGPQDLRIIDKINSSWSSIIYYPTFDFIAKILLQLLEYLHRLVRNWGWAIVVLSIVVYIILFPLSLKQMRSIKDMQALQPHMEELRRLYKDNPQRLNKEMMELYKTHKVNPLGGCLPMLLQIPIYIALWQALQRSIYLKGAGFLWIKDLSLPDRLFMLPSSWWVKEFNILPILVAIMMFVQQKISMVPTGNSASAEQQKIMTFMMPVVFGFAFYGVPSGWVLYFFVNSLLMLVFQYRINRVK